MLSRGWAGKRTLASWLCTDSGGGSLQLSSLRSALLSRQALDDNCAHAGGKEHKTHSATSLCSPPQASPSRAARSPSIFSLIALSSLSHSAFSSSFSAKKRTTDSPNSVFNPKQYLCSAAREGERERIINKSRGRSKEERGRPHLCRPGRSKGPGT